MPSSKGKPTDPELREQLKEGSYAHEVQVTHVHNLTSYFKDIKQQPNKSGGGEGQWSAWKVRAQASPYIITEAV